MGSSFYFRYRIAHYLFTIGEEEGKIVLISKQIEKAKGIKLETKLIKQTKKELEEYFRGNRKEFDIPCKFTGTPYQNKVWKKMQNIPYGKTITYQELAKECGNEKASRAIGNACHHNKILIIVPCHRVVAKNGLGGFGAGIDMKIKLLEMEGVL